MSGVRHEPPWSRRANVVRARLLTKLLDRFSTPITVLVAPAGLGKTTLLGQAFAENRLAPRGVEVWLTCTAEDAVGSTLAEGLCRALGISPPPTVDRALQAVTGAIWHRSPEEVVLVLDDVHEVPAGSSGAELLERLVAALPRNGHVVFVGRQLPPIPLSRLEVQGRLLRLDESDLLFTADELTEFASLRSVDVGQLAECGGWPALVELAATALPGVETSYLWEEVLARIELERRRQLALLAHVGVFDDELASVVLGTEADVAAVTANFPLVTTTSDGGRQIHPLWRPHLAKEVSAEELAAAQRHAGLQMARDGKAAAAVRLLSEAEAWDDVTTVVADALAAPYPPLRGDVVAEWLGRLPDHLTDRPLGRLLAAVTVVQTDPVAAANHLADAAEAFRQEGNEAGELACAAQLAQVAWWSEQPERIIGLAMRLFEMEQEGNDKAFPMACLTRAFIADMASDAEAALAELDRIPPGSLSEASFSLVYWLRSTSLTHLGHPAEGLEAADRASATATLHAPFVEAARLQARWFLGEIEEVLEQFGPLVERGTTTGLGDFSAITAATYCTLLAGVGRPDDAVRYLERARRTAVAPQLPLADVYLVLAEAVLAIATGGEDRAVRLLRDYLDRSPPLGTGLGSFPQRRTMTLWYVLLPESRAMWDATDLGPTWSTARDLARTLVAVRETGQLPGNAPALPEPNRVRSMLPARWATELALAYVAADRQAGWTLLDALWPAAQADVQRHARDPAEPLCRPARSALMRLPVPPAGKLELRLLGPVEFLRDGALVDEPEWRRERVRSLLAHLVLHRPVNRERLAADLWPELTTHAQSRNLRVTLTHLLRVLEPDRAERTASFLVRPHGSGLMLQQGDWMSCDVWRFDELWQRANDADVRGLPSEALDATQQAVALWRDDPSELATYPWALAEVEERRLRLVRLACRGGELLLAHGEPDAARAMADAALRVDPWSERAHHVAVAAHVAVGDHRGAQLALDRYSDALAELGLKADDRAQHLARLTHRPLFRSA